MITYPLFGLCKTPTILWILSMATLCWKLLKPVSGTHENPNQHLCSESRPLPHKRAHTPLSLCEICKLSWAVESVTRLSPQTRCTSEDVDTDCCAEALLQRLRPLRSCNPYLALTSLTARLRTCLTESRGARMLTTIESAPLQSIQQLQQRPHETL